jgi:hypothetical protein
MSSVPYSYVAYIDEAGDPGLQRVKPSDANGSSEWLILSAVVIGAPNEKNVAPWRNDMPHPAKPKWILAAAKSTKR